MLLLLPLLSIIFSLAYAQEAPINVCDYLDLTNCKSVSRQGRRASLLSAPNPTTAALLNPATVSFDRGFGVEAIYQSGNPVLFSAASGTGRVGGALISSNLENTFFANRVIEFDDVFLKRSREKTQYKSDKINLALGGKLYRKKKFFLDLGIIFKRHHEIKNLNPGVGVAGRLGFLTYSAAIYRDDYFQSLKGRIDSNTGLPHLVDHYSESFTVKTYSVGTKYKTFTFDFGGIQSSYNNKDQDSNIKLYSMAYTHKNYMFNLAYRDEKSSIPEFRHDELKLKKSKKAVFTGVQTSLGKHLIMGVNYNYFLLREFSLSATIFF